MNRLGQPLRPRQHRRQGLMETEKSIKDIGAANHTVMHKTLKEFSANIRSSRNLIFSPFAFTCNISLLRSAAVDVTSNQLCRGMGLPGTVSKEVANEAHKKILDGFIAVLPIVLAPRGDIHKPQFFFGCKMIVPLRFRPLQDEFVQMAKNFYHCDVEFGNLFNPLELVQFNDRVAQETNGMVRNVLIPEDYGNRDPRVVGISIISYVYFKGLWEGHNTFKPEDTKRAEWILPNNQKIEVDMMRRKRMYCSYCSTFMLRCLCCALYFEGGRYAMMIYYPRNNFGDHKNEIERIEKSGMKGNTLEAIATQFMRYHRRSRRGDGGFLVDVQMPKFDVKADLTMARTMTEFGIRHVFAQRSAQLPAIRGHTVGDQNPFISHVLHRVHTVIDEAAAPINPHVPTYPHPRATSECRIKIKKLNLNKPFVFSIFDYINNVNVIMGTVNNPNEPVTAVRRF